MHLYELKDSKGRMTMELGIFKCEENARRAVKKVIVPSNSVFLAKMTLHGPVTIEHLNKKGE